MQRKHLNFRATLNKGEVYFSANYVIIVTPADYDVETNYFDTSSIEAVTADVIAVNADGAMTKNIPYQKVILRRLSTAYIAIISFLT